MLCWGPLAVWEQQANEVLGYSNITAFSSPQGPGTVLSLPLDGATGREATFCQVLATQPQPNTCWLLWNKVSVVVSGKINIRRMILTNYSNKLGVRTPILICSVAAAPRTCCSCTWGIALTMPWKQANYYLLIQYHRHSVADIHCLGCLRKTVPFWIH